MMDLYRYQDLLVHHAISIFVQEMDCRDTKENAPKHYKSGTNSRHYLAGMHDISRQYIVNHQYWVFWKKISWFDIILVVIGGITH